MNKNLISISIFACLIVLGGVYYIFSEKQKPKQTQDIVEIDAVDGEDFSGQGFSIEVSEESNSVSQKTPSLIPVPDLNRSVRIPPSMEFQKEEIMKQINDILALLNDDSGLFNQWMDLGLLYKAIEDYEGAREAWEYASSIRPKNSISFGNLAVLYGYYLKNPALAEKNYLKSIENDPKLPHYYVRAADFYLEVLKDKEKARKILEKGLQEIPGEESLQSALGAL